MDVMQPYVWYACFTAVGINVSIIMLMLGVRYAWSGRAALATGFLLLLWSHLFYSAHYAYTHVLAVPYLYAGVLALVLAFSAKRILWKKLLLVLAAEILMGLAGLMAGEANITLIAVLLFFLFLSGLKQWLVNSCVFLAGFAGVLLLFEILMLRSGYIDFTEYDLYRFPLSHWVLMGLSENGIYHEDIYQLSVNTPGILAKQRVHEDLIRSQLESMGFFGFFRHLWNKICITWSTVPYVGSGWKMAVGYRNAHTIFAAFLALKEFRDKKRGATDIFVCALCIVGIFLFLLIWETNFAYYFIYLPMFSLLGLAGMESVWQSPVWKKLHMKQK